MKYKAAINQTKLKVYSSSGSHSTGKVAVRPAICRNSLYIWFVFSASIYCIPVDVDIVADKLVYGKHWKKWDILK